MSDWTVHLVFEEGTSSKFWRARVEGKTLYVNYGKIGSNGQTQVKDLGDPGAAAAEYDKLVRDKRKKGYAEPEAGASGTAAEPDEPDDDNDDDADNGNNGNNGNGDEPGDEPGDEDEAPRAKKAAKPAGPAKLAAASPAAAPARAPSPSSSPPPGVPGHRLVLDAGSRKVEATLYLDGKTVRMDSHESYASPEAATKAFERLKKMLAGEGYKAG